MTARRILKSIFPLAYGLLVYATVRLIQDTQTRYHFWERPLSTNIIELCFSMLVGWLIVYSINRVCCYNDKKQTGFTSGLIARELITVTLLNAIIVNAVLTPMAAFTDDGLSLADFTDINIIPLLYVIIYYAVFRSRIFLTAYVENRLLVERLTNDQLETELKFLKAQYHPHFLFNALNTVYFQMDEDVPAAKNSIEKLSELLRYQLYDQQQRVDIAQELAYLNSFIDLQKVRSTTRLKLTVDFDPALQGQPVYPLLLMPLVENGFKYLGGNHLLNISAKLADGKLVFEVINSVPDVAIAKGKSGGIGLENLRRRLSLLYPGKHQFNTTAEQGTFKAKLVLTL